MINNSTSIQDDACQDPVLNEEQAHGISKTNARWVTLSHFQPVSSLTRKLTYSVPQLLCADSEKIPPQIFQLSNAGL